MMMTPSVRKAALFLHVVTSVGWLGSVVAFLVLSTVAAFSSDSTMVRMAYLALNMVGWYAVVPLNLSAVVTGLVQALGTPWGLFRYYWVIAKLVLTLIGTGLLLMHQGMVTQHAAALLSGNAAPPDESLRQMGVMLVWNAGLGLFLLVVLSGLSIFKPWGLTKGARRRQGEHEAPQNAVGSVPVSLKIFVAGVVLTLLLFMVLHMPNHSSMHHHF